jgi:hypothetical protein
MIPATSTLDSSPSLPTLAAIQRRRRELLAFQAGQRTAPATAPPGDPFDGEESSFEEDACLVQEPAPPSQAIRPSTFWVPVQKTKAPDAGGLMRIVRLKRTLPPDAGGLMRIVRLKRTLPPDAGGLMRIRRLKRTLPPGRCPPRVVTLGYTGHRQGWWVHPDMSKLAFPAVKSGQHVKHSRRTISS